MMALGKKLDGMTFLRIEGVACLAAPGDDGIARRRVRVGSEAGKKFRCGPPFCPHLEYTIKKEDRTGVYNSVSS